MPIDNDQTEKIVASAFGVRGPYRKNIQVQYIEAAPAPATYRRVSLLKTPLQKCEMPPLWWTIEVFCGSERSLTSGAPGREPVPPVGDLLGLSAGIRACTGRLVISYDGDTVVMDIGRGGRYSICANNLSLQAEFPDPMIIISGTNASNETKNIGLENRPANEIKFDTSVEVQVRSNIAPVGRRTSFLTQSVEVTGATAQLIPIPNRAIGFQAYQSSVGSPGAPTEMEWSNDATVRQGVGDIAFVAQNTGVEFQTAKLSIPGTAAFVNTGTQNRSLTFVWELEL